VPPPGCISDSECPPNLACIRGECRNPCLDAKPCGENAECTVVNTLPVRTMICICIPGYKGFALIRCDPRKNCLSFTSKLNCILKPKRNLRRRPLYSNSHMRASSGWFRRLSAFFGYFRTLLFFRLILKSAFVHTIQRVIHTRPQGRCEQ